MDDEFTKQLSHQLAEAGRELASLRAKLAEWEAAGRVLAARVAQAIEDHHQHEPENKPDRCDCSRCQSMHAIDANPLASRLVAEAKEIQ